MTDAQILETVCRAETRSERLRIIKEWAPALGLSESEAVGLAKKAALL